MGSGASVLNDNRGILLTLFTVREGYIIRHGFRLDLIGVNNEDTEMLADIHAYDSDEITIDYDYDAGVEQ